MRFWSLGLAFAAVLLTAPAGASTSPPPDGLQGIGASQDITRTRFFTTNGLLAQATSDEQAAADAAASAELYIDALDLLDSGDEKGARALLRTLIKRYPGTEHADRAFDKLDKMSTVASPAPPLSPAPAVPAPGVPAQGHMTSGTINKAALKAGLGGLAGGGVFRGIRIVTWAAVYRELIPQNEEGYDLQVYGEYIPATEWVRPLPAAAGGLAAYGLTRKDAPSLPFWVPMVGTFVGQLVVGIPSGTLGAIIFAQSGDMAPWQILGFTGATVGGGIGAALVTRIYLKNNTSPVAQRRTNFSVQPFVVAGSRIPGLLVSGNF